MSDLTGMAHTVVCVSGAWLRLLVQTQYLWFKVMLMSICHTLCVCVLELLWKSINAALNTTIHVLQEHCCSPHSKHLLTCLCCYKSICPMQGLDPDPLSCDIFMCCYKNSGEGKGSKRILIPIILVTTYEYIKGSWIWIQPLHGAYAIITTKTCQ